MAANRSELLERVEGLLPPGWQPCPPSAVEHRFVLIAHDSGTYELAANEYVLARGLELELALTMLDAQLRQHLGVESPNGVFIHAGAVAHNDRAIVMPGQSFSGKTTLVAALVHAGATYYSDEFAVVDECGLVHPYAKPLSLRTDGVEQTDHTIESLGWTAGSEPLTLGAIVVTRYRADAGWDPRVLSSGEGAMALLSNAVPARTRPAEVMRAVSRAAKSAIAIESERGEAGEIAPLLLAALERLSIERHR